jgi:hypothetical protein
LIDDESRLDGVDTVGVDETAFLGPVRCLV